MSRAHHEMARAVTLDELAFLVEGWARDAPGGWCKQRFPLETNASPPIICTERAGHKGDHRYAVHDTVERDGQQWLVTRWAVRWNNDADWPP